MDAERYARQIMLPEIGPDGQCRLACSSALVVGVGGLGSPAALYLTAAGVGRIGIMDADSVSLSNLQRQILYSSSETGEPKVRAAARRLGALSPATTIEAYCRELTAADAETLIDRYDIVVECSDNFATRYLVDETCRRAGKPWVYASIEGFRGQASLFEPDAAVRYSDLFPDREGLEARGRASGGVLGPVAGVMGCIQAAEAIKRLAGVPNTLAGRLLTVDLLREEFRTFAL